MATLRERFDAAQARLEEAANAVRHGDKNVNYDLAVLTRERDRLAALVAAQGTERTTRTLLSMESE